MNLRSFMDPRVFVTKKLQQFIIQRPELFNRIQSFCRDSLKFFEFSEKELTDSELKEYSDLIKRFEVFQKFISSRSIYEIFKKPNLKLS